MNCSVMWAATGPGPDAFFRFSTNEYPYNGIISSTQTAVTAGRIATGTKFMDKTFRFSNSHTDYQARDAKSVFGWRYSPRIVFKAGKGTKLIDLDDNEY